MHAEVKIGDSMIMLNDHFPEFGAPPIPEGSWPFLLHVYVPDADALMAQASAAGCEVKMPLMDQFWGDRYGQVQDPFGFRWAVATRKEELTPEQMHERMMQAMSGSGAAS
jgi:uncharacterized glyoxalase superfamily protein PhnB